MTDAAPYTGSAVPAPTAGAAESPRRGLGIWSLALGLLSVLGVVVVVIVVAEAARTLSVDINSGLVNLFNAAVIAVILMAGGFIGSITGLILGIMAVSRGRGRVLGVIGILCRSWWYWDTWSGSSSLPRPAAVC